MSDTRFQKVLTTIAAEWDIDSRELFELEVSDEEKIMAFILVRSGRNSMREACGILRAGGSLVPKRSEGHTDKEKTSPPDDVVKKQEIQARREAANKKIDSETGEILSDDNRDIKPEKLEAGSDAGQERQTDMTAQISYAGTMVEENNPQIISKKRALCFLGFHKKNKTREDVYNEYATIIDKDLPVESQKVIVAGINAGMPARSLKMIQKKKYSAEILRQLVITWIRLAEIEAGKKAIEDSKAKEAAV